MSRIAVIEITEFPDGAVASMVSAFSSAAREAGHEVDATVAERDHVCSCGGCCSEGGCGDDDCLCTFSSESVDQADVVVFALPCDGDLRMGQLRRIAEKSVGKCSARPRRLMLMSCSPSFEESVFSKVSEFFRDLCASVGWEYAGEALVEGLPDACQGGDPISRRRSVRLASLC